MAPKKKKTAATKSRGDTKTLNTKAPAKDGVRSVLAELERLGSKERLDEMGPRYGIQADKAFGVAMADMQKIAKRIGRNHTLAIDLWKSGWYEARTVAALIDEPSQVTPSQMDEWCNDFDNWAICDSVCFILFDRTPHAFEKVAQWAKKTDEFVRRGSFALLASLALHDKGSEEERYTRCLPLIERAASDERNFVKKAVNWALRAIGERSTKLNTAAIAVAERLAKASSESARWVGKDALKQLGTPAVLKRLAARKSTRG